MERNNHTNDSGSWRRWRRFAVIGCVCFVLVASLLAVLIPAIRVRSPDYSDLLLTTATADTEPVADMQWRVQRFCGDCHSVPLPGSFPRDAWHEEVSRGYEVYALSGRNDLAPPPFRETLAYYRSQSPPQFQFSAPPVLAKPPAVVFVVEPLGLGQPPDLAPAVSHLKWTRTNSREAPRLLVSDMRRGSVTAVDLRDLRRTARVLAQLHNPCHVEPCDLDGDDVLDLVVADLGSFFPDDHSFGRVVWLRAQSGSSDCETTVLQAGLGRVSDVRPIDADGDRDLDLLVAEFGADRTGGIHLLENHSMPGNLPRFSSHPVDSRSGTIHIPVHDFNGDGRPDFLALVSQQYEQVDLFLNHSGGRFARQTLWSAPDLTFASSGMELVDLDQDGDTDILYTNGDSFDNSYLSPSHGVQWLEQRDGFRFVHHRLADLPGAYRALAGDLDLDGDQDIIASVWMPPQVRPASFDRDAAASLVYLEQTAAGVFVCHALEVGAPYHAALELGDFDADGDLDLAVGRHMMSGRLRATDSTSSPVAVWWNQRTSSQQTDD